MSTDVVPGVVAVVLVSLATLVIGTWGLRISRTTSDFFVASRTVRPRLNASAIGGEYLSAASCKRRHKFNVVIPGWSEGPDPESRDSGFASSMRPGMTGE